MSVIHNEGGLTTLTGTTSADTFVIDREFGQRTIESFDTTSDKVDLSAYEDSDGNLSLEITQKGDHVIVNLTPFENGNLILKDVSAADLTSGHFSVNGTTTLNVLDADEVYWDIISDEFWQGNAGDNREDPFDDIATNNLSHGGDGDDHIYGWLGDDIIFGGDGDDLLEGEQGYDIIYGGDGNDEIHGGTDLGVLEISNVPHFNAPDSGNEIYGEGGNDWIEVEHGLNLIDGGSGHNNIHIIHESTGHIIHDMKNKGEDVIWSFSSEDVIEIKGLNSTALSLTKSGNDVLVKMADNGGESGWIKIKNTSISDLSPDQFIGIETFASDETETPADGDPIHGTPGDDVIEGTSAGETIKGYAGNDTIRGHDGNDHIWGGDGNDSLFGQEGDDYLHGEAGNDFIHGNDGADTIYAGDGDDHVKGGEEATGDTIYGEAGNDRLNGGGGNDTLYGGEGNDDLKGYEDNDTLYGGAGDDIVGGSTGNAGKGNDAMYGDAGDDTVDGGVGSDTVSGGSGTNTVSGGSGADTFVYIMSEQGVDTFTDFSAEDTLDIQGLVGTELVLAEVGNDVVIDMSDNGGTAGSITLQGVALSSLSASQFTGIDTLTDKNAPAPAPAPVPDDPEDIRSGHGDDTVTTGSGNDTIRAQKGDDIIDAGAGDDFIVAGKGDDTITGGEGADIHWYGTAGAGDDIIKDFSVGEDVIQLHGFGLDYATLSAAFETDDNGDAIVHLAHPSNSSLDATITLEGVTVQELSAGDFLF